MTSSNRQEASLAQAISRGWTSLRKFAWIIDVSYPTVCKMRDRGDFRIIKVGGIYRVSFDEIKRFLREGNIQPGSEPEVLEAPEEPEVSKVPEVPELNGGEKSPPSFPPLPTHPRDD